MATTIGQRHHVQHSPISNAIHPNDLHHQEIAVSFIAEDWLAKFAGICTLAKVADLWLVVHEDAWWRDHLGLSWDLRTFRGYKTIALFLTERLTKLEMCNFQIQRDGTFGPRHTIPFDGLDWVESMFSFDSKYGHGKGMMRLVYVGGTWKAHMLYTSLQTLWNARETTENPRPYGGRNFSPGDTAEGNWYEQRERRREFIDHNPNVFILGAGQAGLILTARLQTMGVSCLLVDKNERVGDNWRQRYRTPDTHGPVNYTHMAYMPFPANWPMFSPKDKLADWFEAYASSMGLNVWLRTTVQSAEFSEELKLWTVCVMRDGTKRTLQPKHVVICTEQAGEPLIPSFPGQDEFEGEIYHGSRLRDASFSGNVVGKKVVVVGTGNSGHDIAQNYYENGAKVTMLQRRGMYVITAKTGLFMLQAGLHDEDGPSTEEADIYAQSLPIPVQFALDTGSTARIKAAEKNVRHGLRNAGFKLDFDIDNAGIYRKYITRGGGYYIDVGASQLIIDRKIKVVHEPNGIDHFESGAVVVASGEKLEADVVVLATGFDNMRTTLRKTLGDTVADRCKDVWDFDEEGEVNAMIHVAPIWTSSILIYGW